MDVLLQVFVFVFVFVFVLISQGRTDHATRQTHRWPQTAPHDVLSPLTGPHVSHGCQERIGGQMCGAFAERPSKMCLAAQCCTALLKLTRTLLRFFPSGTPARRSTGCTTILPTPKSVPTVGLIRDVLCRRVVSQQLLTLYSGQFWRSFAHIATQALNSLPTWTTGTCGSNHSAYYGQLLLSQLPPDQSTLLCSPPRHKCGKALARTPFHPSSKTRSRSHLVVWEDIYKSMATLSPALLFWKSRPPWSKQHNAFRKIATTLADLNAEGLNAQAVNDLLTMYVGAASQHVLRISCVPEQEARNFDRQVTSFWSQLIQRDIASPLFILPLKLGGHGVGSAVQRHAAAPWRAWQSIIPSLIAATQSPDTDSLFSSTPLLRAQLTQLQSTLSLPVNKPTFQFKPLGAALRPGNHSEETSLHHPKKHPQANLRQCHRHTH